MARNDNRQERREERREERQEARQTADASAGTISYGNVGPNTTLNLSANAGNAYAGPQGRGQRPSQNAPRNRPMPAYDVPGYNRAQQNWQGMADGALRSRDDRMDQARNSYREQLQEYRSALRDQTRAQRQQDRATAGTGDIGGTKDFASYVSNIGQTNASGGFKGDRQNTGPGGGRDTGRGSVSFTTPATPIQGGSPYGGGGGWTGNAYPNVSQGTINPNLMGGARPIAPPPMRGQYPGVAPPGQTATAGMALIPEYTQAISSNPALAGMSFQQWIAQFYPQLALAGPAAQNTFLP